MPLGCRRGGELVRIQHRVNIQYAHSVSAHGDDRKELTLHRTASAGSPLTAVISKRELIRMAPQHAERKANDPLTAANYLERSASPAATVGSPTRFFGNEFQERRLVLQSEWRCAKRWRTERRAASVHLRARLACAPVCGRGSRSAGRPPRSCRVSRRSRRSPCRTPRAAGMRRAHPARAARAPRGRRSRGWRRARRAHPRPARLSPIRGSGSQGPTYCSRSVRAARSRSMHSRVTVVTSQASGDRSSSVAPRCQRR